MDGGWRAEGGGESSLCEIQLKVKVDKIAPRSPDTLFSALFFHQASKMYPSELKSHLHSPQSDSMGLFDS